MLRLPLLKHSLLLALGILVWGAGAAVSAQTVLQQIHGVVFAPDGKGVMVLTHTGLAVYRTGRWTYLADVPRDFRALALTKNAIYASGRRGPDLPLSEVSGLMKSTDSGRTWTQLALPAQANFRFMAAGLQSNVVYLIGAAPKSVIPQPAIYHTSDDGQSWHSAAAHDLSSTIASIAVHPAEPRMLAVGTPDGAYVSRDSGVTFRHLAGRSVTAVLFDLDGEHLYIAREDAAAVQRVSVNSHGVRSLALPIAQRDFIIHIAQNPSRSQELAVATHLASIFFSRNGGVTWRAIAREGRPA